jgi:hypothetical protein
MVTKSWREREAAIVALVPGLLDALLVRVHRKPVEVRMFFCKGVMDVVHYIREETKGMESGAQHHVFKILSKHAEYGDLGRFEVPTKGERMDIYFDESMVSIEVKTLANATLEAIQDKTMAAFEQGPADKTWIFFLYRFEGHASPRPPCQYLLAWIAIDSLDIEFDLVAKQVVLMVLKAKEQAAKKLGVPGKILIPVENIIRVVDVERELTEKNKEIEEKDKTIAEKNKEIEEKDKTIAEKNKEIASLKKRPSTEN